MYRELNTSLINFQSDFSLLKNQGSAKPNRKVQVSPINSPKSLSLIFVCGGGGRGGRYITSSYIPSYKKNILQHYKINVQVGLHCKVE